MKEQVKSPDKDWDKFFIALVIAIIFMLIGSSCYQEEGITGIFICHVTNDAGETNELRVNRNCDFCETEEEFLYIATTGFDCDSISNLTLQYH